MLRFAGDSCVEAEEVPAGSLCGDRLRPHPYRCPYRSPYRTHRGAVGLGGLEETLGSGTLSAFETEIPPIRTLPFAAPCVVSCVVEPRCVAWLPEGPMRA